MESHRLGWRGYMIIASYVILVAWLLRIMILRIILVTWYLCSDFILITWYLCKTIIIVTYFSHHTLFSSYVIHVKGSTFARWSGNVITDGGTMVDTDDDDDDLWWSMNIYLLIYRRFLWYSCERNKI